MNSDQYEYFVALANDRSGNETTAQSIASDMLIDDIVRYLGIHVIDDSDPVMRAVLTDFQITIRNQIERSDSAPAAGFQVIDRYVSYDKNDAPTVYLLARYARPALQDERTRLQAIFYEQIETIDRPLRQGDQLERAAHYIAALERYMEAARFSSLEDTEDARIKFEDSIHRIASLIGRFVFTKLNDNLVAETRNDFPEPFLARLTSGIDGLPVFDAPILVSYKVLRPNGDLGVRTASFKTDSDGIIRFQHPVPEFAGNESVTMWLSIFDQLEDIDDVIPNLRVHIDPLIDLALKQRVVFYYQITPPVAKIATGILVTETDFGGNPRRETNTAQGVLQALTDAGYEVAILKFDPRQLIENSSSELIAILQRAFRGQFERIIYGITMLEAFEELDNGAQVTVSGTLNVLEIEEGRIMYTIALSQRSRSSSLTNAVGVSFRRLGIKFGEDLVNNLN